MVIEILPDSNFACAGYANAILWIHYLYPFSDL